MLTEAFPKLNTSRVILGLRAFLRSRWFIALIALLMVCSELFSLELYVIGAYAVLGLAIVLVSEDTLPAVPMAVCGYMLMSAKNNIGFHPDSLLAQPYAQFTIGFCVAVLAVCFLGRLVSKLMERKKRGVPKFLSGFVLLGAAYLLGGLGSSFYDAASALFGVVQILALSGFYFYFYFTVDWENTPEDYLAELFAIVGVGVFLEVIGTYFNPGAPGLDGQGDRGQLYTGWGVWNCVGCVMAMCMPAPIYFAVKKKHGWIYSLVSCVFYLGVILTQSRGSILFGSAVFIACIVYNLYKAKGREKLWCGIVYAALLVGAAIAAVLFRDKLADIFASLINAGMNDSGRLDLYDQCWNSFLKHPVFGVGWYDSPGIQLGNGSMYPNGDPHLEGYFIPGFAHNTFFQLIGCGGAFALIAYLFHRTQTVLLVFRDPTPTKIVAALCVAAMLLTSFVDNHVFNMGPGLLYSVLLVFAEKERSPQPALLKRK